MYNSPVARYTFVYHQTFGLDIITALPCIETFLYIIYTYGRAWAKVLDFAGVTVFCAGNRIILYTIFILQEKVSRFARFVALPVGHKGNKCVTFMHDICKR